MPRQALYRRYRPRRFADVVGQDVAVQVLREAVRRDLLSHAYLLAGPRGTGKTSVARILAEAAACHAPDDGEPCGRCPSCLAAEGTGHLDIVEIDAASNRGIDEVRDLRERVLHAPVLGRRKVYVVDEVHMLTTEAFNAFLKTLEEPPAHVLFIFATTEPHKLPITVLSRCQRYDFHRIPEPLLVARLRAVAEAEGLEAEEAALVRIAGASDGGLRDALSLLDQVMAGGPVTDARVRDILGALDEGLLAPVVEALLRGDPAGLLEAVDAAYDAGRDPRQLLRDVARRLRDMWVQELFGAEGGRPGGPRPTAAWIAALEHLAEAEARLRGTFPPRLILELGLVKAAEALAPREAAAADPWPTASAGGDEPASSAVAEAKGISGAPDTPATGTVPAPASELPAAFRQVLERLRQRRQMTAALFRQVTVEEGDDAVTVWFHYPAHLKVLEDERSGHRALFLECFRDVYGPKAVRWAVREDAGPRGPSAASMLERARAVFGPDVPVEIVEEG
ncbi:MAG: DNA polymerase III subunit gamma/tau [Actinomycetia bacterium]|nr:DNA polymerase III subunit gamma/tau [Actinomycetes bacterium]